ncbi:MAG: hypothetical protein PUC06_02710 [Oscillospiraceae bacterium]|nr:hypothetical protein [Oscillospiraceae bacterium]
MSCRKNKTKRIRISRLDTRIAFPLYLPASANCMTEPVMQEALLLLCSGNSIDITRLKLQQLVTQKTRLLYFGGRTMIFQGLVILIFAGLFLGFGVLISNAYEKSRNRNVYVYGIPRPSAAIVISMVGLVVFQAFKPHSILQLFFSLVGLYYALYSVYKKMAHAKPALVISAICISICVVELILEFQ